MRYREYAIRERGTGREFGSPWSGKPLVYSSKVVVESVIEHIIRRAEKNGEEPPELELLVREVVVGKWRKAGKAKAKTKRKGQEKVNYR